MKPSSLASMIMVVGNESLFYKRIQITGLPRRAPLQDAAERCLSGARTLEAGSINELLPAKQSVDSGSLFV